MRYPLAWREQKRAAGVAAVLAVKAHVTYRAMPPNLGYDGNGCSKSFAGVATRVTACTPALSPYIVTR
jgi:hypothetical protein